MDCPRCGIANTPAATRCDCGYDLTQPAPVIRADRDRLIRRSRMLILGGCALVAAGAGGLALTALLAAALGRGRVSVWTGAIVVGFALVADGVRRLQQAKIAKQDDEEERGGRPR